MKKRMCSISVTLLIGIILIACKSSQPEQRIAFMSVETAGPGQLYVMNADGSALTRLVDNLAPNISELGVGNLFTWSPDGSKIAYVTPIEFNYDEDYIKNDLVVMNADGSGQTTITSDARKPHLYPQWSPDSSKIIFTSAGGLIPEGVKYDDSDGIFSINADGSEETHLTNKLEPTLQPQWSPDGSKVVFASVFSPEIFIMNVDGSERTKADLMHRATQDIHFRWSYDGSKIAFAAINELDTGFGIDIYTINARGAEQTKLAESIIIADNEDFDEYNMTAFWLEWFFLGGKSPIGEGLFAWSPDGSKIAFTSNQNDNFDIYVVNADGSAQTRLTSSPTADYFPAWSSDGDHIAFISLDEETETSSIYIMNADGSDQTELVEPWNAMIFELTWVPGSQQ